MNTLQQRRGSGHRHRKIGAIKTNFGSIMARFYKLRHYESFPNYQNGIRRCLPDIQLGLLYIPESFNHTNSNTLLPPTGE